MNENTQIKCTYCGSLIDKTDEVCPQCSAPLRPAQPAKQQTKPLAPTAIASMVLGILSICFSSLVIPGFILSSIGKRKANEGYEAIAAHPDTYTGEGFLKTGRITSKVGLFFSIGYIIFWIFYIVYIIWLINLINN